MKHIFASPIYWYVFAIALAAHAGYWIEQGNYIGAGVDIVMVLSSIGLSFVWLLKGDKK